MNQENTANSNVSGRLLKLISFKCLVRSKQNNHVMKLHSQKKITTVTAESIRNGKLLTLSWLTALIPV